MRAVDMARQTALGALACFLPAQRHNLAAVTAPGRRERRNRLEAMRNTMVDLVAILVLQAE